jgi:hypothetical protein
MIFLEKSRRMRRLRALLAPYNVVSVPGRQSLLHDSCRVDAMAVCCTCPRAAGRTAHASCANDAPTTDVGNLSGGDRAGIDRMRTKP